MKCALAQLSKISFSLSFGSHQSGGLTLVANVPFKLLVRFRGVTCLTRFFDDHVLGKLVTKAFKVGVAKSYSLASSLRCLKSEHIIVGNYCRARYYCVLMNYVRPWQWGLCRCLYRGL